MLRCKHCDSEAVMPKSGLCLSCGAVSIDEFSSEKSKDTEVERKNAAVVSLIDELEIVAIEKAEAERAEAERVEAERIEAERAEAERAEDALVDDKVVEAVETDENGNVVADDLISHIDVFANPVDTEIDIELVEEANELPEPEEAVDIIADEEVIENPVEDIDDGYEMVPSPIKTRKVNFPENVENRAQLRQEYKNIVNSCQHSLEKLKGELIVGDQEKHCSFMLTSANRKEGVTVAALSIAIGLSRFGNSKVLLIDANAISPQIQNLFSINNCDGFTEYITDTVSKVGVSSIFQALKSGKNRDGLAWAKCSYYTEYDGLYAMPYSKGDPVSLWELVEDKTFQERLDALKDVFDYIVLDGAPVMSSSESAVLSQYVDGVVLVIKAEQTKWEIAELAVNTVRKAGGVFVGSILNRRKFYIPKFLYGWI